MKKHYTYLLKTPTPTPNISETSVTEHTERVNRLNKAFFLFN